MANNLPFRDYTVTQNPGGAFIQIDIVEGEEMIICSAAWGTAWDSPNWLVYKSIKKSDSVFQGYPYIYTMAAVDPVTHLPIVGFKAKASEALTYFP